MDASPRVKPFPTFCFQTPGKLISRYPWDVFFPWLLCPDQSWLSCSPGVIRAHSRGPFVSLVLLISFGSALAPNSSPPRKIRGQNESVMYLRSWQLEESNILGEDLLSSNVPC